MCARLVTVDEESDIIRLVHYIAQEYLEPSQKQWFPNEESDIARTCVAYLSFNVFDKGFCQSDDNFEERQRLNTVYDYAAHSWGYHVRAALIEDDDLILGFLESKMSLSSACQAMLASSRTRGYSQDLPGGLAGLHVASFFGMKDAIAALILKGHDPNAKDTWARTPLSWAAGQGHLLYLRHLLTQTTKTGVVTRP